jgi:hypothetical protein
MSDVFATFNAGHKEGCLWGDDPHHAHCTPVDCVTVADLWRAIESQKHEIEDLAAKVVHLKAKIYDLMDEDGE